MTAHRATPPRAAGALHRRKHRLRLPLAVTAAVAASATGLALFSFADTDAAAGPVPPDQLQRQFAAAANEFHVPQSVLLALSYQQSRWETHNGQPSTTGNYNVMGLVDVDVAAVNKALAQGPGPETDGRGEGAPATTKPAPLRIEDSPALHSLERAAKLIDRPSSQLKADPAQSIRGGAALLVKYQKDLGKQPSDDPSAWYDAVSRFNESTSDESGHAFADRVFNTIRIGAVRTTANGQQVTLSAVSNVRTGTGAKIAPRSFADGQGTLPTLPADARAAGTASTTAGRTTGSGTSGKKTPSGHSSPSAASRDLVRTALQTGAPALAAPAVDEPHPIECPDGLGCNFVPSAYVLPDPAKPSNYRNYAIANRPADGDKIEYIVIHDAETTFQGAVNFFSTTAGTSAHYVVGSQGQVTQLVNTKNIAWQAGNKTVNMHSVGVEHEGWAFPSATQSWYSEQLYQTSATLVRYLAEKFDVPLDRQHIIGHDDVAPPTQEWVGGMHWDPGTFWDWNHYMDLLGAPIRSNTGGTLLVGGKVTIAPAFDSTNTPPVDGIGARPENFVYLYTAPDGAALLNSSTSQASDTRAKAVAGTSYVVADQQGDWTAIWYDGKKAWFHNPNFRTGVADNRAGQTVVTPKSGSIPVYGRTYPELSAYPADFGTTDDPVPTPDPLSATIPAGQAYVAGSPVPLESDFYLSRNFNGDGGPYDRTRVVGTDKYYPIRYNHRLAYLKASDVTVVTNTTPAPSGYTPAGPARLLDTRIGLGAPTGKVGGGQSLRLQVAGADLGGGRTVPNDITAVVLNVTATEPNDPSYVAVYPDGQPRSSASNLNFTPGQTIPNLVVVPVVNGKVDLFNNSGTVHLIADITGYYSPSGTSKLNTAGPARLLDTRIGLGAPTGKVGGGQSLPLQVAGADLGGGKTVPNDITAVVLNVTATEPTDSSYVAVYPDGQQRSSASNLNFTPGQTIPNLVVVPVVNGKVDLYNNSGAVHLIADISGYYRESAGSSFVSAGPTRLLDTRIGLGAPVGKVGGAQSLPLQVAGRAGVPDNITAVVLNVTATEPNDPSYVAVYPDGQQRSSASNLNFTPGQTIPNLVVVPVVNGKVDLYNNSGTVHLIADITGYFTG